MTRPSFSLSLTLPAWVDQLIDLERPYRTDEEKMSLANALASENVKNDTGGPFGAAIFDRTNHRLVAPGVNLVVPASNPTAHAEVVAIGMAGTRLGGYDLSNEGALPAVLVSSVEPCAMCLGATPWSGVSRLIIGARDADARAIGFDEGDKPANWVEALNARGIEVTQDVLREEAASVLNAYAAAGNEIYNSSPTADQRDE